MKTSSSLVHLTGRRLLFEMEIALHTAYTFIILHPIVCLRADAYYSPLTFSGYFELKCFFREQETVFTCVFDGAAWIRPPALGYISVQLIYYLVLVKGNSN